MGKPISQNAIVTAEKLSLQPRWMVTNQFSWDGDICVHGANETLLVNGLIPDKDELSSNIISPVYNGTITSTSLPIEGKRGDYA